MSLVAGLQSAKNGNGVLDVGLADRDWLETSLQGGVFFHVLAILVQRGSADAAEFAAGQGRLEQIRGVAATFGPARADNRVKLVDEEHHVAASRLP